MKRVWSSPTATKSALCEIRKILKIVLLGGDIDFASPAPTTFSTIWIKQALMLCEVADYRLLRPAEIVNWMNLVEESRIHISDDTRDANGHVNLNGHSHDFVEENDQGGDVMANIWED